MISKNSFIICHEDIGPFKSDYPYYIVDTDNVGSLLFSLLETEPESNVGISNDTTSDLQITWYYIGEKKQWWVNNSVILNYFSTEDSYKKTIRDKKIKLLLK